MAVEPQLSHTAAVILQAIHAGRIYGFGVMEVTGLPSGTVYPAMRRPERDDLITSRWGASVHCGCGAKTIAWRFVVMEIRGQEDVKKLKNRYGEISALKKVAPGCPVSDRWGVGIHFAPAHISAKSISSHLPDGTGTFRK